MMFLATTITAVLLPLAAGAGTVSVTFVNHMDNRNLTVTTPAGAQIIGSFQFGGKLTVTIPVPESGEAVTVSWTVGDQHGSFSINAETAGNLRVDLKHGGPVGPYAVE
jgi:hypothetical protein